MLEAMYLELNNLFFLEQNRWAEMFSCLVARASVIDVISGGMGGTRNGALQVVCLFASVFSVLSTFPLPLLLQIWNS